MKTYTKKLKAVVLDMDDCFMGFIDMFCFLAREIYKINVSPSNFTEYDMRKINYVDVNGNEVKGDDLFEIFKKLEEEGGLYSHLKPLVDGQKALETIHKYGYRIILLTARKPEYELQTIANLAVHKIIYDDLLFCPSEEKAKMIRKLSKDYNIVAFADDKASTVRDVFENTNVNEVYLIDQPHNRKEEIDEEITRLNRLFDIIHYLKIID